MNEAENNLFSSLSRWAASEQENFLTESFAYLLEHLRITEAQAFVAIISRLTRDGVCVDATDLNGVTVDTQVATEHGYPDLELTGPGFHVFIEVKDRSPVDPGQLDRYSRALQESSAETRCLVLLTRYAPPWDLKARFLVTPVRWSEVAVWLNDFVPPDQDAEPVAEFLAQEFLWFLKGKGMTIEKVGYELNEGVDSLRILRDMIGEALHACGIEKIWSAGGHNFTGFGVPYAGATTQTVQLLVHFDSPSILEPIVAEDLIPEKSRADWSPADRGWRVRQLNLSSEEVHFFARTVDSQRNVLEGFIRDGLDLLDPPISSAADGQP